MKRIKFIKSIPLLLLGLSLCWTAWADPKNNPYHDPDKGGYNFADDNRPWFDGKDYPFYLEMFDGKGIKPQEEGTYQEFPRESVPVRMVLGKLQPVYEAMVPIAERAIRPPNPTQATPESIERGKVLFNTYCTVCHGHDGNMGTPVAQKGQGKLAIPPIGVLITVQTESHLYNKIRFGSYYNTGAYLPAPGLMPPYGAQTSVTDRWDMVNYMKSPNFGKEGN